MAFVITAAVIGAGASLIGGMMSSSAASKAADAQVQAANTNVDLQKAIFQKQTELQEPFRAAGITAQNRLLDLLGLSGNTTAKGYGSMGEQFSQNKFTADPGYAFRLSEGQKALDASAAARGGLLSGNTLKGAIDYGQNAASQEYQNAFNRYQTERANILNPLQSLGGVGQTSANTLGNAAQNYANQAGNAYTQAGNAQASGYIGQANAWNQALGGASNALAKGFTNYGLYSQPQQTWWGTPTSGYGYA
jgi:hypothetical protein